VYIAILIAYKSIARRVIFKRKGKELDIGISFPEMGPNDYDFIRREVAQGRKLVIFEDSILDVQNFIKKHPYGASLLEEHIG
jgi:hypothetical protein